MAKHSMTSHFSKTMLALGVSLSLLWPIWPNAQANETQNGELLDRIIAVVNDKIILKTELDMRMIQAREELRTRNINVADMDGLANKVLDTMILEELQKERIDQRGIKVSDEELLEQIREIAEENNLTVITLRDRLNLSQPKGFAKFREQLRDKMQFQKLREIEVIAKTQVTEDEIDNYIQRQNLVQNSTEYNLGHIMVNLPDSATPAQRDASRSKANEILQKLRQGEDFSQMAVRYSDGSKALQGGDLGWLGLDQIPTFFSPVVQDMEIGQISDLVRSPVGFHILKLQGKRNKDSDIVKQYHLYRFILLSDKAKDAKEPPQALIDLANRIDSLEAFKALNKEYSDIPASVNANGNLGWQTLQEMPLDYYNAVLELQPGQAAKPIATEQGWEIIYLDAIRDQDMALANKRKQAMQTLRMKKANETYEIWLRRLKDEALIDIRLKDPAIMTKPEPAEDA